jgi:hypothetical protein
LIDPTSGKEERDGAKNAIFSEGWAIESSFFLKVLLKKV